jgi:hypothetical protein
MLRIPYYMTQKNSNKLVLVKKTTTQRVPTKDVKTVKVTRQKKNNKNKKSKNSNSGKTALTEAGAAFQKCTLAPADFTVNTGFQGIPDDYDGLTVSKAFKLINSFPTYTTGNDVYILQLPIPGVAYFYGQRTAGSAGTITLSAVCYDDAASLFYPGKETDNVQAFRYASNVIEIIPTVNEMTWGGSIQVWKSRVSAGIGVDSTALGTANPSLAIIDGLGSINSVKASSVFPFIDGCYVPAFNTESNYSWTPIIPNFPWADLNANIALAVPAGRDAVVTFGTGFPINYMGVGSFEGTFIKIPAAIVGQTAVIRSWACVEFQVNPLSSLYDYAHMSPMCDPVALMMVKEFHKSLPAGVCWKDNASFWESFLLWSKRITSVGKLIPGPVGQLMGGFNSLITEGHGLW